MAFWFVERDEKREEARGRWGARTDVAVGSWLLLVESALPLPVLCQSSRGII
jgi:hypothetical protein